MHLDILNKRIDAAVDTFKTIIVWLAIAAASAPIWATLLYVLWQGLIRPRLIPSADIERLAADLRERHGERAADAAFAGEHRAWRHSDGFEQGKWRRVRRRIERGHGQD
jgi:hypothetical protein